MFAKTNYLRFGGLENPVCVALVIRDHVYVYVYVAGNNPGKKVCVIQRYHSICSDTLVLRVFRAKLNVALRSTVCRH